MAKRQGLALRKSRTRNETAPSFGNYRLLDPSRNRVVVGAHPFDYSFTLDEVEQWLTESDC